MRALSIIAALGILTVVSGDVSRPAAIIPWSEYQKRLREQVEEEQRELANEEIAAFAQLHKSPIPASEGALKPFPDSMMKSLSRSFNEERPSYSTGSVNNKVMQTLKKPRPNGQSVIRPQLRTRRPDDPRTFLSRSSLPSEIEPPHYNPPRTKPAFAMVDASHHLPTGAIAAIERQGGLAPLPPAAAKRPLQPLQFGSNTLLSKPFETEGESLARSAFSSSSSNLAAPSYSRLGPAPGLILSGTNGQPNIVNSIFSQSQAHGVVNEIPLGGIPNGIPQLPPPPPQITPQLASDLFAGLPPSPMQSSGGIQNLFQSSLPTHGFSGADNGVVAGGPRSPLEGLLAHGSPFESLGKMAKNFLGGSNGGGNNNLLDVMTNALTSVGKGGGVNSVGTANAIDPPIIEAPRRAEPSLMEKLFNSAASALNESMKAKERQDKLDVMKREEEEKEKQRESEEKESIKQARMSKDVKNSLKLLDGLPAEQRALLEEALNSGEIDSAALAPAIKSLVKDDTKEESQKEKVDRLIDWIKTNRPHKNVITPVNTGDKLPYYGKYCGSLAAQDGSIKRPTKPSGAIWAVDKDRFIVSKFHFQPSSLNDNVTFWLGPDHSTLDLVADSFPSSNGFILQPEPIDINVFVVADLKPIAARARNESEKMIQPVSIFGNSLRVKRDAPIHIDRDELPPMEEKKEEVRLVVKGDAVRVQSGDVDEPKPTMTNAINGLPPTDMSLFNHVIPRGFEMRPPIMTQEDPSAPKALEWFAGFQPLLLRLPSTRSVKSVNWISLRDHKHNETIASVIMPNGPGFTIPSMTTLRPLTPNGLFNISSGQIKVHDHKTIEITDFVLKTEGKALWFMIGTDILPNSGGHIVPLWNRASHTFDCDSLRDYNGETVTIRLPGKKDMNDVFWLSVFSIPSTISYSHIYLPYNEMVIPPDLSGIPTPQCIYTP